MPPRNAATDRFSRIDQAEITARADEEITKKPPERPKKPAKLKAKPGVRQPNVQYPRDGKIYAILPQDLCDEVDAAVLRERKRRRPAIFDKSMLVEEALIAWLKGRK